MEEAMFWSDMSVIMIVWIVITAILVMHAMARKDGYDVGYQDGYNDALEDIEREQNRLWVTRY